MMNQLISPLTEGINTRNGAAVSMLATCYKRFEAEYKAVAVMNGLLCYNEAKMPADKVEAMLLEANINRTSFPPFGTILRCLFF